MSAANAIKMGKATAKIFRSKTRKKVPLAVLSPNEPLHGPRRSKRKTPSSCASEGKENTPVRSSRERTRNDEDEQQTQATRSFNECKHSLTGQKRDNSKDPSPVSGLRGDGKGSQGDDRVPGSHTDTSVGVLKEECFLPHEAVRNLQTDACSPSQDGEGSGAPVEKSVECQPSCPKCYDERRLTACSSREEDIVPTELGAVPGSKAHSLAEESGHRRGSGETRAPTKTYRRRTSREGITPSVLKPPEKPSSRDKDSIQSAGVCRFSDELQEAIDGTTEKIRRTSKCSNASHQRLTPQKRLRSTDSSSLSRLHGSDGGSRGEDSRAGSGTDELVTVLKEGISPKDNTTAKKIPCTDIADACSPSGDAIQIGAPVCIAGERQPDCLESRAEDQVLACRSHVENRASIELATMIGSKPGAVPPIQSSMEDYEDRPTSERKTTSVKAPEQRSCREQEGINWIAFCKSAELQDSIARATDKLHEAYDKLYKKYQNLKTSQLVEAAEAFDEQSRRIELFSTAADDLVQNLRSRNSLWDHQEDMINRSRAMEVAYIECQNDLVMERARNLELRKHLENVELRGSKLLHELLENLTQLTISHHGKSEIVFSHDQSGYEFKLEQNGLSKEVGGANALHYSVVSPGTILHLAPEWMQIEHVFDATQALIFFRRMAVALRGDQ